MIIHLKKRNGAHVECVFKCGVEFIVLLYSPNEESSNSYELYLLDSSDDIPDDLDDLDTGLMEYAYDKFQNNTRIDVFHYEYFTSCRHGQWYDVWAHVVDCGDHYEIDVFLHETITHDN